MKKCPMGYEPCRSWNDTSKILRCAKTHSTGSRICVGWSLALERQGVMEGQPIAAEVEEFPETIADVITRSATQLRADIASHWSLIDAAPVLTEMPPRSAFTMGDDKNVRVPVDREEFETV